MLPIYTESKKRKVRLKVDGKVDTDAIIDSYRISRCDVV